MIERRRYMGLTALPYDYEVEYLEGSSTAFIDTNINLDYDTVVRAKWAFINWGARLFDCGKDWSTNYFSVGSSSQQIWYLGKNSLQIGPTYQDIIHCEYGNFYIKNLDSGIIISQGATRPPFTLSKSLTIFGQARAHIYYLQFLKDDALIHDFIPVRIGTTGYMYDKVSGQLFGNTGTGSFILGPDKNSVTIITQQHEMYG